MRKRAVAWCVVFLAVHTSVLSGCSDDHKVSSDEEARRAYLGLDRSIGKSLNLGFDGFNAAKSANIPPQSTTGDEAGTLTITGQVDQGSSDNKEMRLYVGLVGYCDGEIPVDDAGHTIRVTYDTAADPQNQPYLQLSLRNIPNGTFTGSLTGTYQLSGDLSGTVTLNLTMNGAIRDGGGGRVERVPGSTHVTGTATAGPGVYSVDIML